MQESGPNLLEAAEWIQKYRGARVVVKLGGELLARPATIRSLSRQVSVLTQTGLCPILVHGAGVQVDAACRERGIEIVKHDGRRVTTPETLEVLSDVLRGLNNSLVEGLTHWGVPARGLMDAEDMAVYCTRRPSGEINWGEVGDVQRVDPDRLSNGSQWTVPVLPSLGRDEEGSLYNVNADSVASKTAQDSGAKKLVFLTSVPGVMQSLEDPGPISHMNPAEAEELLQTPSVKGGMKAKLGEALKAISGGVPMVHIISGFEPWTLLREIYTDAGCGTLISAD